MVRAPLPLVCLAAACLFAGGAQALGLGAVNRPPVLGQVLDLTVPITLGDGEALEASCVDADVQMGSSRVPADRLAVEVQPGPRPGEVLVRVRSGAATTEPVIVLSLTAGCPTRATRRYTLLTELPETAAVPAAFTTVPAVAPGGGAPAVVRAAERAEAAASIAPRTAAGAEPPGDRASIATAQPSPRPRDVRRAPATPAAAPTRAVAPKTSPPADAVRPAAGSSTTNATDAAATESGGPRPVSTAAALAASPAEAPAEPAAPAALRPRDDTNDDRGIAVALLLAALAAAGGAAGALAWRRRLSAVVRPGAGTPSQMAAVPSTPHPAPRAPAAAATLAVARPGPVASRPAVAPPTSPPADRVVAGGAGPVTPAVAPTTIGADASMPLLDLSLDEQIDLEQQVEFFAVLGREDAAVELLQDHLRRAGGRLPLAYLKLLEIQRRLGDRAAYEATARRFGDSFGVNVPAWDATAPPRGLDDDPVRLDALQRRWACPPNAMAWLDALLHGRADGGGRVGLAAYDDALLLYRIARDLHDQGADEPAGVDLLLPDDAPLPHDRWHVVPPAVRRGAESRPRDLGASLHVDLDVDRLAAEADREALVVR
jgi:hypothetical protein